MKKFLTLILLLITGVVPSVAFGNIKFIKSDASVLAEVFENYFDDTSRALNVFKKVYNKETGIDEEGMVLVCLAGLYEIDLENSSKCKIIWEELVHDDVENFRLLFDKKCKSHKGYKFDQFGSESGDWGSICDIGGRYDTPIVESELVSKFKAAAKELSCNTDNDYGYSVSDTVITKPCRSEVGRDYTGFGFADFQIRYSASFVAKNNKELQQYKLFTDACKKFSGSQSEGFTCFRRIIKDKEHAIRYLRLAAIEFDNFGCVDDIQFREYDGYKDIGYIKCSKDGIDMTIEVMYNK